MALTSAGVVPSGPSRLTNCFAIYHGCGCKFTLLALWPMLYSDSYFTNSYLRARLLSMLTKSERRDLFPGALELMILQSLRVKPMHGYALVKHIQQVSDDLLQIEEGSLYPALQRMLRQGWLESDAGVSLKGRPTRIYRLSRAGRKHLEQEVSSFEKMFAGITRVLATSKG